MAGAIGRVGRGRPMPQTREHVPPDSQGRLCPTAVVFIENKVDLVDDPELLDWSSSRFRECSQKYGFPGDKTPVIRGQSKAAVDKPKDDTICKPIDGPL